MKTRLRGLAELRRLFRLESGYIDMDGERRTADPEASLLVLRALGAQLDERAGVADATKVRRAELDRLAIQPVHVAWNGALSRLLVRLPHDECETVAIEIRCESGAVEQLRLRAEPVHARPRNGWRATHAIALRRSMPLGYHVCSIDTSAATFETFIIAAPRHAFAPPQARDWGVFIPLYALASPRSWGVGDYSDLADLTRWTGALGGGFVGTLPLLATFLDAPFEPSPYSPASRLFWNELFLDVTAVPGWDPARIHEIARELAECRAGSLVDYRAIAALKRRELEFAAHAAHADSTVRDALATFTASHPRVTEFAQFRAVCDRLRSSWTSWPERLRHGTITPADYAAEDLAYHIFVQWQADQQISRVAAARDDHAAALYLDMPLGVNPDSYDVWRFPDLFAHGISAGAPPDPLFTGGQTWGFRPLHPDALRNSRYAYVIETLRHHLRVSNMLRLDHVMSLHRLFWVPDGVPARNGVYVRYAEDELFAVLVLESARHEAIVVGEDLGTVPAAVRRAMHRHNVQRMHVVQFEASPDEHVPVASPAANVVASLNTHDMPTFAGFWRGSDIEDQLDLGLIEHDEYELALRRRAQLCRRLGRLTGVGANADVGTVRDRLLLQLAASAARYVLVTLEDLWLEDRPQNVPGTATERPNWRRRARHTFEEFVTDDVVVQLLRDLHRCRTTNAHVAGAGHG